MHQIPNILSVLRLLASVPLVILILHHEYLDAMVLGLFIGITDMADGSLARRLGWTSRFGMIIDPMADKINLIAAVIALCWVGHIPWQLVGLVALRESLVFYGALQMQITPSLLSKWNSLLFFLLIILILMMQVLLSEGWNQPLAQRLEVLIAPMIWLVAVTELASGMHYLYLFNRFLRLSSS